MFFYESHCLIDFKLKGTVDIIFSGPLLSDVYTL